jgi:hypothetical protein
MRNPADRNDRLDAQRDIPTYPAGYTAYCCRVSFTREIQSSVSSLNDLIGCCRSIRVRHSHLGHSTTNPAMSYPRSSRLFWIVNVLLTFTVKKGGIQLRPDEPERLDQQYRTSTLKSLFHKRTRSMFDRILKIT